MCVLKGSQAPNLFFYCIGLTAGGVSWGPGIPAYARGANITELYALDKASRWVLIFRQAMPYLWPSSAAQSLNPENPDSELFSILDQLEQFRDASGAFTFKLIWPDTANRWIQASNPVQELVAVGYQPIEVPNDEVPFGGLRLATDSGNALVAGSAGATWYFAIGG